MNVKILVIFQACCRLFFSMHAWLFLYTKCIFWAQNVQRNLINPTIYKRPPTTGIFRPRALSVVLKEKPKSGRRKSRRTRSELLVLSQRSCLGLLHLAGAEHLSAQNRSSPFREEMHAKNLLTSTLVRQLHYYPSPKGK